MFAPDGGHPEFVSAKAVAARYGCSVMTLWRWLRRPEMGFPKPLYFGANRFWRMSDLLAWEATRPREKSDAADYRADAAA